MKRNNNKYHQNIVHTNLREIFQAFLEQTLSGDPYKLTYHIPFQGDFHHHPL